MLKITKWNLMDPRMHEDDKLKHYYIRELIRNSKFEIQNFLIPTTR